MAWDAVSMEPYFTVLLASDSVYLYWVYVMKAVEQVANPLMPSEKMKQHAVYVQVLTLEVSYVTATCLVIHFFVCFTVLRGGVVSSEARQALAIDAAMPRGTV